LRAVFGAGRGFGAARAITKALADANLTPADVDYISAHGTATERGDIAESHATAAIFGDKTPISSLKSFFGHTLGACGAVEAWLSLEMIEIAPRSCSTFSAAIVSGRTRLSAKDTSVGILGLRLWQIIVMSNSSACELTP
jgi:3-oxoacyl-(acyl-carrier-protein) synthase